MYNTKKYLYIIFIWSGFARIKPRVNCFVHRYCFVYKNLIVYKNFPRNLCLRSSKNSLKLNPQNSILDPRKLKLKPQNSILDNRKLWGSRTEFRVETVNLHLNGTVSIEVDQVYKLLLKIYTCLESRNIFLSKIPAHPFRQCTANQSNPSQQLQFSRRSCQTKPGLLHFSANNIISKWLNW